MSIAQRFAQVFGAIYLLVGILGFVPPLLFGDVEGAGNLAGPFTGFLLGLFAVNWLHNIAHAAIGAAGLAVYRSPAGASIYALVIGVVYTALFVVGLIWGLTFLGGLLPLNGIDHILHIVTALAAFGAYFASRAREEPGTVSP